MEVPQIVIEDFDNNAVTSSVENVIKVGSETASGAALSTNLSTDLLKAPSVPELQDFPVHELTNEELSTIADELGIIHTSFPENHSPVFEGQINFPESYYTVNAKERLLLLFAENFRRQFMDKYKRRPLILALRNECDVQVNYCKIKIKFCFLYSISLMLFMQKFVSTTIRPTAFLFTDMICAWEPCCTFVADYIIYECLEKPTVMVSQYFMFFFMNQQIVLYPYRSISFVI